MPSPVPNSEVMFPKTIVSDGEFVLFTPGNPGVVTIEGGGGSGTLPTTDAADATVGSPTSTTVLVVGAQDPSGNAQPLKVDVSGNLLTSGGGGGGSNPAAGPTGVAVPADASYTGINVGGVLQGVSVANPMPTSLTGNVTVVQPTGTNLHTTVDNFPATQPVSGTVAVSGNVTVVQPTGTNLHAVLDSTSTTTVTQATGTNLHTVVDSGTVSIGAALPSGTNVIGHVIADTGSTTTVTGNVTVVQPTGTNLHAVLDATSTTTVTQATGTNLHTVIDSGTTTVTQATGTNLHTVVDSGSVTANAGTNLNTSALALDTSVQGLHVAQGSTTSGQTGELVQGAVTTAAPTYVTGQTSPISLNTGGALRVTLDSAAASVTVDGDRTNNGAAPASTNMGVLPAIANAATQTWTEGRQVLESVDLGGGLRTVPNIIPTSSATWNSGTSTNTAITINTLNYPTAVLTISVSGNSTGGVIVVEGSTDGGATYPFGLSGLTLPQTTAGYSAVSSTGQSLVLNGVAVSNYYNCAGMDHVRARLSSAITGAGVATVGLSASGISSVPALVVGSSDTTNGAVFVKQNSGANLVVNVNSLPTLSTVTTVSTVSAARIVGNTGSTIDASVGAGTAPTVGLAQLVRYVSTAPALTANQTVSQQADSAGTQFVRPYRRSQYKATPVTITASTSPVTAVAAQGAAVFADITGFIVTVTAAATTDTAFTITLSDGTASYVFDMDSGALATATAAPPPLVIAFPTPLPATTANTAWTATSSSATPTVHIVTTFIINLAN